jgi:serine/threonine-protein kinase
MTGMEVDLTAPFAVFDQQDSGCTSYGVVHEGTRLFVKVATTPEAADSLRRAVDFHAAVQHPAIVAPIEVHDGGGIDVRLISTWHDGEVLNAATSRGSDRSGLARFRTEPLEVVRRAVATILDAHLAVAAAGFVAVDLYDGCFLWDTATRTMRLIDLNKYRPGPFEVPGDRLPGSLRYLAPEERQHGGRIDERTTVFGLGRTLQHLLDHPDGWRGTAHERTVIGRATDPDPRRRFASVAELVDAWQPQPQRIAVIGTGGSGKTTMAKRLAAALDLPHLELDAVYHQAGWEPLPDGEFRDQVQAFRAGDRWVTCGKYAVVRDLLFDRADTIVCLDHGRVRQTTRVWRRSFRRWATRETLWNGNRERLRGLWPFGPPEQTLTGWVWIGIPRVRALYDRLEADPPSGAVVVRLRGWAEIEEYVQATDGPVET